MKKLMFAFATVLALATTISLSSCAEDPCKNVECGVHGTCNAGTCDCAVGYQKDTNGRCDLEVSQKFIGTFVQKDKAETVQDTAYCTETYDIVIKKLGTDPSKIEISNFAGSATKFTATVSTTAPTTFVLDAKQTFTANGVVFAAEGSGSITADGKTLTVKYVFSDSKGARIFGCSASGLKK